MVGCRAYPSDIKAGRRLYAAALRDICGLPMREVADLCDYANENSALKRIQVARPVWGGFGSVALGDGHG